MANNQDAIIIFEMDNNQDAETNHQNVIHLTITSHNTNEWCPNMKIIGCDEKTKCVTRDGVLAPPLLAYRRPGASPVKLSPLSKLEKKIEAPSSSKRSFPRGEGNAILRLLKNEGHDYYVLQLIEENKDDAPFYKLSRIKGKERILTKKIKIDVDLLVHVTDKNPPEFAKEANLTLKERLDGPWLIIRSKRIANPNKVPDVFYRHPGWPTRMRSISEVASFIIYGKAY